MPRGKYTNRKGKQRRIPKPEEIQEQMIEEEKKLSSREERCDDSSSHNDDCAGVSKTSDGLILISSVSKESCSKEEFEAIGGGNLIEVEKKVKKITILDYESDKSAPKIPISNLSHNEKKKIEGAKYFWKLHNAGKTWQAEADLPRLAVIRREREEAAKRREEETIRKEQAKKEKGWKEEEAKQKKLAVTKKPSDKKTA